jgi:glutathione S-transferase
MRIYDFALGPYPSRVRIALDEKGLTPQIEFVDVDGPGGEHKTPEFRAKNYSGTVPVLELDDGTFIAECTAITQYLDTLDGKPTLTGTTPKEQGVIHMMTKRAEIEFLDAVSVYFHHATPGLGPKVERYQNPEWGEHQREKAFRGLRYLDGILQKQPYIATDYFSMADLAVIGGLIFMGYLQLEVPDDCTAIPAWFAKVKERPSVAAWFALQAEGLKAMQGR